MISKRLTVPRLATWATIAAIMTLLALGVSSTTPVAEGANPHEMSVTPAASIGALGGTIDVKAEVTKAVTPIAYSGWQSKIRYDSSVITFVPVGTKKVVYAYDPASALHTTASDVLVSGTIREVSFGSPTQPPNPVNALATVRFACGATPGYTSLHLTDSVDSPASYSTVLDAGANAMPTDLVDASIICARMADLQIVKTDNAPVHATGSVVYTNTIVSGVAPTGKVYNPVATTVVADIMPVEKKVQGTTGVTPACVALPANCVGTPTMFPTGVTVTVNGNPTTARYAWFEGFMYPGFGFVRNLVLVDFSGGLLGGANVIISPGDTIVVTVTADIPLSDAGKPNMNITLASLLAMSGWPPTPPAEYDPIRTNEADCSIIQDYDDDGDLLIDEDPVDLVDNDQDGDIDEDPNGLADRNFGCQLTVVDPAVVNITKAGPAQILQGNSGSYTLTVTSTGTSPASDVDVTDTVGADYTVGTPTTTQGACTKVGNAVTCDIVDAATQMNASVTVTIPFTCVNPGTVLNKGKVTWHDGIVGATGKWSNEVSTICLPPFNGMIKDGSMTTAGIQSTINLWLCKQPNDDCGLRSWWGGPMIGKGVLDIAELIFLHADIDSPNDTDTLPEGLAAYEEQLKYDHKIFDISVADAGFDGLDNDQDGYIDEVGESVLDARGRANINCNTTILTENWILFGCVTAGQQLGDPMPVAKWLKTIHVTPDTDMFLRIRPTKDNGVVSTLLDENCEVADIYASEPWPDTLAGGLTPDCADITITVRMLEGDVNLDCVVDVMDEQALAYRYGASFGLLLYNSFYDLEPKYTDFDIDIKDVQFVFGRDGSTCQAPIPNQPPMAGAELP